MLSRFGYRNRLCIGWLHSLNPNDAKGLLEPKVFQCKMRMFRHIPHARRFFAIFNGRALSVLIFNHSLRWRHSCSVVKLSGLESQAIPLLRKQNVSLSLIYALVRKAAASQSEAADGKTPQPASVPPRVKRSAPKSPAMRSASVWCWHPSCKPAHAASLVLQGGWRPHPFGKVSFSTRVGLSRRESRSPNSASSGQAM